MSPELAHQASGGGGGGRGGERGEERGRGGGRGWEESRTRYGSKEILKKTTCKANVMVGERGGGRGGGQRGGGDRRQGACVLLSATTRRIIIQEWQTYKKFCTLNAKHSRIQFGYTSLAYCRDFQKKIPQTRWYNEVL